MRLFFLCFFLLLAVVSIGQINKYGVPEITNYISTQYNSSEQNWSIIQDKRGIIYAGNTDNVVEFDGKNWNRYSLDNNSIIRSFQIDNEGTIYVGGVGEFGYLKPTENGSLVYQNLTHQIDSANAKFNDIWKIYINENGVYFCSQLKIFQFQNLELVNILTPKQYSFITFFVGGKIYAGNYAEGLMYFEGDSMIRAPGGEAFERINIFTIIPTSEGKFLIGTDNGVYSYDPALGYVKKNVIQSKINRYFKDYTLYGGIQLADNNFAWNTIFGGAFILNEKGRPLYKFDKESGLGDIQITSIYQNQSTKKEDEALWLTHLNGFSRVDVNSPVRFFDDRFGLFGSIYSIIEFKKTLYVATSVGVFYLKFDENDLPSFVQLPEIKSTWDLLVFEYKNNEMLFAGTELGLFQIRDTNYVIAHEDQVVNLFPKGTKYQVYDLMSTKDEPNKLFVGGNGLTVLSFNEKTNSWKQTHHVTEKSNTRDVAYHKGKVWITTLNEGIYSVVLNDKGYEYEYYDTARGLPAIHSNKVHVYNDNLLINSRKGFYTFDEVQNRIVADSTFGEEFVNTGNAITQTFLEPNGNVWICVEEEGQNIIKRLILNADGTYTLSEKPFKVFPKISTEDIYFGQDDMVWIGISNKLYSFNLNYEKNYDKKYNTLIRKVTIGQDSTIFNGTNFRVKEDGRRVVDLKQPNEMKFVLDYKYNGLTFQYVAPFFENEEDLVYSSYLQGFKDPWSLWTNRTERVYTNLDRGHYTFMVKAKNVYGVESEVAEFHFTILPPWYKTIVAYLSYFVLAIVIVVLIVKIYTRRLELEKIRLEGIVAERTAEVVHQKEEIEKQRDEIEEQKEHIMDSIVYARRIQQAVVPSPERAEEVLPEHFLLWLPHSVVSGDFWWMTEKDNKIIVVAADCTGHGVPGAFMSMLGVSFLNEIVNKMDHVQANLILNQLRTSVKTTLKQTGKEGEAKDGMDLALVIIDLKAKKLQYAGAYNPLFVYRGEELIELKADRNPIGIYIKEKESFTNNDFDFQSGDTFYIFSDGYVDQFGGDKGQKFKTKNFKALLTEIQKEPMQKQKEILNQKILDWRGDTDQVDDIIVLGVRLP